MNSYNSLTWGYCYIESLERLRVPRILESIIGLSTLSGGPSKLREDKLFDTQMVLTAFLGPLPLVLTRPIFWY